MKFTLPMAGDSIDRMALPAISPDGRSVAIVKGGSLWVQPLDQLEAKSLAGTTGAQLPFWSPDSREIAYFTATDLWRVAIDGTPPVRIASAKFTRGGRTSGGVWLADRIVFAPATSGSGLLSVPLEGGEFTVFQEPPTDTGAISIVRACCRMAVRSSSPSIGVVRAPIPLACWRTAYGKTS